MSRVSQIMGCGESLPNRGICLCKSPEVRSMVLWGNCEWLTQPEILSAKERGLWVKRWTGLGKMSLCFCPAGRGEPGAGCAPVQVLGATA